MMFRSNKKIAKEKREQASLLSRVGDGVTKVTKNNEKKGEQVLLLLKLGNGTHLHPLAPLNNKIKKKK
jgi:hypothetical protein